MDLTVAQCRAARALLGWTAADVATAASIGIMTVKRFEGGQTVNAASLSKIRSALIEGGITFIAAGELSQDGGNGLRLTSTLPG
jgi:transcriptional regulator with XRE-family HTH domain